MKGLRGYGLLQGYRHTGRIAGWIKAWIACFFTMLMLLPVSALAMEPVRITLDDIAIDITSTIDSYRQTDGALQVSTAPDAEGIVRRVEVRSKTANPVSHWAVFALANTTDEQIDRLLVSPHYRMVNSGVFRPDLDTSRIIAITPSEGFSLDRQVDTEADVFLITLDPGAVITFIAEQKTADLTKLYLWEPDAYKDTTNSYTLYYGIVLGISGLLALFLTILFVVKGSAMFPATACLAWGVLAYICVDFGFWNKVVSAPVSNEPFWRAGAEVFLAASLVVFLYAYLSLSRWHNRLSLIAIGWIMALIIVMGAAVFEPHLASGVARVSIAISVLVGIFLVFYLAFKQYDRAVMLIPTWILLTFWTAGAAMTVTGQIENDIIQPALGGGLVLVVLLLCFTVMQHAFAGGVFAQGLVSDAERAALALTGSGDIMWDWDVNRNMLSVGDGLGELLHHDRRELNASPDNWKKIIHPNDRDRFQSTLSAIVEHKRGKISQAFRLRSNDGQYHWFKLRARPLLDLAGEVARCIGTLSDVTAQQRAEDRLLRDSVHDHLTGLENREIFTSRLQTLIDLAADRESKLRPTVFHIDIDGFSEINKTYGYNNADNMLMAIARRLDRLLRTGDSLARVSGDQFVLMLVSETEPKQIAAFANAIRSTVKAPMDFADEEIVLSTSIGLVSWTAEHKRAEQMMRDAELAKREAKRKGGDNTETFHPALRSSKDESIILLDDLKNAMALEQIELVYQPIVSLDDRCIHGFEALARWRHPRLGLLMPNDFVPIAESSGLIQELSLHIMEKAARDFAAIEPRDGHKYFVSVNISSRELLRTDIVQDISGILETTGLEAEQLRIELTESLVMENPEHSTQILNRIKALGIGISLDDFGTGHSSLAYLMKFPFDTIKIDKSFVQARGQNERLVVLRSIITLAQGLNQSIIAEGVEYENDLVELMQLGCKYVQGYLLGEPVNIDGVHVALEEERKAAAE